jgi:hypothetical protein
MFFINPFFQKKTIAQNSRILNSTLLLRDRPSAVCVIAIGAVVRILCIKVWQYRYRFFTRKSTTALARLSPGGS